MTRDTKQRKVPITHI